MLQTQRLVSFFLFVIPSWSKKFHENKSKVTFLKSFPPQSHCLHGTTFRSRLTLLLSIQCCIKMWIVRRDYNIHSSLRKGTKTWVGICSALVFWRQQIYLLPGFWVGELSNNNPYSQNLCEKRETKKEWGRELFLMKTGNG